MIPNLFGLGDPTKDEIALAADSLLKLGVNLTPSVIRDYFLLLPDKAWKDAGLALLDRGVNPQIVAAGLQLAQAKVRIPWSTVGGALTVASAALSAYHGYRRNQSIGWGLWWFIMGTLFPIVVPVLAVSQGFGQPKPE